MIALRASILHFVLGSFMAFQKTSLLHFAAERLLVDFW
jgi:hypothetical protein